MAKKTVDFGKLSLPERPAMLKKEEDPVQMERAIERIHRTETATAEPPRPAKRVGEGRSAAAKPAPKMAAKPASSQPKTAARKAAPARRQAAAPVENDDEMVKKISMDLPVSIYTYVKMRSFQQATTMREFVLGLLREEMRRVPV